MLSVRSQGNYTIIVLERVTCQVLPYSATYYIIIYYLVLFLTINSPTISSCKLCSVWELNERLDCKSMEIKWYIYIKVDRVGKRVKGQATETRWYASETNDVLTWYRQSVTPPPRFDGVVKAVERKMKAETILPSFISLDIELYSKRYPPQPLRRLCLKRRPPQPLGDCIQRGVVI